MSFQRFSFNYYSTIFSSIFDIVLVDAYFPCKKCLLAKKLFWELKNWYGHVFSKIKTKNFDENQKFRGTQTLNKFLLLAFIFPREINIMNEIICWSSKLHRSYHFHCTINENHVCATFWQYPRRPIQSGTFPLFVQQFNNLWNSVPKMWNRSCKRVSVPQIVEQRAKFNISSFLGTL